MFSPLEPGGEPGLVEPRVASPLDAMLSAKA